jgi:hypothetical protein
VLFPDSIRKRRFAGLTGRTGVVGVSEPSLLRAGMRMSMLIDGGTAQPKHEGALAAAVFARSLWFSLMHCGRKRLDIPKRLWLSSASTELIGDWTSAITRRRAYWESCTDSGLRQRVGSLCGVCL